MVVSKHLLNLFFVSVFTSANTRYVEGSEKSCPNGSIVYLTPFSSGSVNKSDDENTSGYICNFDNCLPICCPEKFSASLKGCVANEATNRSSDFEPDGKNPCNSMWKEFDSRMTGDNIGSREALLFDEDTHFCLLPEQNVTNDSTCRDHPVFGVEDTWALVSSSVAIFFKLITFIVYIVVPELNKNLQGWIIISFLASDIGNTFLIILNLVLLRNICTKGNLYIAMGNIFFSRLSKFSDKKL